MRFSWGLRAPCVRVHACVLPCVRFRLAAVGGREGGWYSEKEGECGESLRRHAMRPSVCAHQAGSYLAGPSHLIIYTGYACLSVCA